MRKTPKRRFTQKHKQTRRQNPHRWRDHTALEPVISATSRGYFIVYNVLYVSSNMRVVPTYRGNVSVGFVCYRTYLYNLISPAPRRAPNILLRLRKNTREESEPPPLIDAIFLYMLIYYARVITI